MLKNLIKYSRWLIIIAIILFALSALTLFSSKLTPPQNLGSVKKTTVAEILADLSYFSFLAGAFLNLVVNFWKKENNEKKIIENS